MAASSVPAPITRPEPASPEIRGTCLDVLEIDDPLGRGDLIFDPAEQVGSAREGDAVRGIEQLDRVIDARGGSEVKSVHGRYAFPSLEAAARALSTFRGVIGHSGTRTPMALVTALAMAAAVAIVGGSPTPITPRAF